MCIVGLKLTREGVPFGYCLSIIFKVMAHLQHSTIDADVARRYIYNFHTLYCSRYCHQPTNYCGTLISKMTRLQTINASAVDYCYQTRSRSRSRSSAGVHSRNFIMSHSPSSPMNSAHLVLTYPAGQITITQLCLYRPHMDTCR